MQSHPLRRLSIPAFGPGSPRISVRRAALAAGAACGLVAAAALFRSAGPVSADLLLRFCAALLPAAGLLFSSAAVAAAGLLFFFGPRGPESRARRVAAGALFFGGLVFLALSFAVRSGAFAFAGVVPAGC